MSSYSGLPELITGSRKEEYHGKKQNMMKTHKKVKAKAINSEEQKQAQSKKKTKNHLHWVMSCTALWTGIGIHLHVWSGTRKCIQEELSRTLGERRGSSG